MDQPPSSPKVCTRPGGVPGLALPGVWRASDLGRTSAPVQPTGWEQLDRALPGGGWPSQALTEVLAPQPALLEWRLLGPALARVCAHGRQIVVIAPPRQPYLPGLRQAGLDERRFVWIQAEQPAERLWVAEQILRANACGALIVWLVEVRAEQLRRLQLSAQACDALAFVCRPQAARHAGSAAPLRVLARLGLHWELRLEILKRRGPPLEAPLLLPCLPGALAGVITPRLHQPGRLFRQEAPVHAMDRPVIAARPPHTAALP